jgi:D-alanyl-D-alanine carboxypeptidase (penicillin-binding protein 5/6)
LLNRSAYRRVSRVAAFVAVTGCAVAATQLGSLMSAQAASVARRTPPAGVIAAAGELANVASGRLMWSRGLDTRLPIASLTKVMTAIVVLSGGDLSRKIRVTDAAEQYAAANGATTAGLYVGDVLTARQLLVGMLLQSGADAAYLLANSYGPGRHAFVRKMNATARRLGMTHTHFANVDGLPWPTPTSTYSTPHDLVIMGEAAMKLPGFRAIVSQRSHWVGATGAHHGYYWRSTDLLLTQYPGAIGIKTGFTRAAGFCLLFEARRGHTELMGVVLGSADGSERYAAAERLLDWGFARG